MKKGIVAIITIFATLLTASGTKAKEEIINNSNIEVQKVYSDLNAHWGKEFIEFLSQNEILNGYFDGTIRPDRFISRAEFISIINKVFGYIELSNDGFNDISEKDWFYTDMLKAKKAGYIKGYSGNTAKPNDTITREEATAILYRVFKLETSSNWILEAVDDLDISEYAKPAITELVRLEVISGFDDGTIRPKNNLTRAEASKIISKLVSGICNREGVYENKIIDGNLIVNKSNVTLKKLEIKGNLYLSEGIGEGTVDIEDVRVYGRTYVNGGGYHAITCKNSILGELKNEERPNAIYEMSIVNNSTINTSQIVSVYKPDKKLEILIEPTFLGAFTSDIRVKDGDEYIKGFNLFYGNEFSISDGYTGVVRIVNNLISDRSKVNIKILENR